MFTKSYGVDTVLFLISDVKELVQDHRQTEELAGVWTEILTPGSSSESSTRL